MTIERLLDAGRAFDDGDLERAERIYRQVWEADPRSSIAVVGLARVAARRGEAEAAAALARRALAIDPGNVAAVRLLSTPPSDEAESDGEWPWPDLEDQLRRYGGARDGARGKRAASASRLERLLRRGRP